MTILSKSEKVESRIEIDLTGPQGNVFCLLGIAADLAKQLNRLRGTDSLNPKQIQNEMRSSDYENAVQTLDRYFGEYIVLYR